MILALATTLTALVTAPSDFEAFFKEFAARREGLVSMRAHYTEKTIAPGESFEVEGALLYFKPRRIIRRTAPPDNTAIVVDDRRCYQYEPEIKQMVIYELDNDPQANVLFLGFDSDTDALRKAYDVSLFTIEDEASGKKGILIKPKADEENPWFREVNLYLREEDYLPYRIRMVHEDDSQLIIEVRDIEKNPRLDLAESQVAIAADTKVILNDQVLETVGAGGKLVPERPADPSGKPVAAEAASPALIEARPLDSPPPAE